MEQKLGNVRYHLDLTFNYYACFSLPGTSKYVECEFVPHPDEWWCKQYLCLHAECTSIRKFIMKGKNLFVILCYSP